ncbi:MAG: hypothetical protein WBX15_18920 [Thermoanaerobaculia bacterium]
MSELAGLRMIAHVRQVEAGRRTELLDLVKARHALDPAILEEHPPYFWRAEISNDQLDSHFTHMSRATLSNYAADAQKGVAFLKGHNWRELPIGQSLTGALEEQAGKTRVLADFYTVPGEPEIDSLIHRMRAGTLKDVSVGFYGGQTTCDICGRDIWDWDCPHVPGLNYEVKEGDVVRQTLSTFTIEGAHLAEVSGVFDGSTPDASILKANRMAEAGELSVARIREFEEQYRVKLSAPRRDRKGKVKTAEEQLQAIRAALEEVGIKNQDACDGVSQLTADLDQYRGLAEKAGELEAQAADGRSYRADLIAAALAEGVRAYGEKFDRLTYEGMLKTAPLGTIKRMRDDWADLGANRFQGGRQTQDEEAEEKTQAPKYVPDAAYGG